MEIPKSPEAIADGMEASYFLVGLINRFNNRFQAVADRLFEHLSWKQVFLLNCITLFPEPPTIKDLAELVGCSHQNAKQLLGKLERVGFVLLEQDPADRRKQRICLTEAGARFRATYDRPSDQAMTALFRQVDPADLATAILVLTQLDDHLNRYQEALP